MSQLITQRPENGRRRVQTDDFGPSKAVQSQKDRADIKKIIARYKNTGIVDHLANVDRVFRDVSEFTDFADLMRQTKEAERQFMTLPSKLRAVFDHSVERWLDVAHDPEKFEEIRPKLEELGVLEKAAAPVVPAAVPPAPVVP